MTRDRREGVVDGAGLAFVGGLDEERQLGGDERGVLREDRGEAGHVAGLDGHAEERLGGAAIAFGRRAEEGLAGVSAAAFGEGECGGPRRAIEDAGGLPRSRGRGRGPRRGGRRRRP